MPREEEEKGEAKEAGRVLEEREDEDQSEREEDEDEDNEDEFEFEEEEEEIRTGEEIEDEEDTEDVIGWTPAGVVFTAEPKRSIYSTTGSCAWSASMYSSRSAG